MRAFSIDEVLVKGIPIDKLLVNRPFGPPARFSIDKLLVCMRIRRE